MPTPSRKKSSNKRLFVLDTNILIHDPTAIFRFAEHDVYLPMAVLEELDNAKKGVSEVARSVREVSRYISELIANVSHENIVKGIALPQKRIDFGKTIAPTGKLFLQTRELSKALPVNVPGSKTDNAVLALMLGLQEERDVRVTLVSKDMNLRIKAGILGISNEDYFNDRVMDDIRLLHTGTHELPKNFWESHGKKLDSWKESGRTFYKVTGAHVSEWFPNDCLYLSSEEEPFEAIVRRVEGNSAVIEYAKDYTQSKHAVWGITARNREQNFAMNLLMDPSVDFITLQGQAGTGKTLLTLAAALTQTLEQKHFQEIIMTRATFPLGEDIGFLPGTEVEKMTPWMGALMDNLEVLTHNEDHSEWGRAATQDLLMNYIKIRSLNFMRGRTFLNKFIIIDEAQNLTSKQMKALITRAGPGTKMVCLGDIAQIDTPYLTENTSGLTYAIDRFKSWSHSGHITMRRGERSRLADYAVAVL